MSVDVTRPNLDPEGDIPAFVRRPRPVRRRGRKVWMTILLVIGVITVLGAWALHQSLEIGWLSAAGVALFSAVMAPVCTALVRDLIGLCDLLGRWSAAVGIIGGVALLTGWSWLVLVPLLGLVGTLVALGVISTLLFIVLPYLFWNEGTIVEMVV